MANHSLKFIMCMTILAEPAGWVHWSKIIVNFLDLSIAPTQVLPHYSYGVLFTIFPSLYVSILACEWLS